MLLADGGAVFAPVAGMVGGIAAMALANHERLKLRIEVLEKRLAQAEWRGQPRRSNSSSGNLRFLIFAAVPGSSGIGEHNDHPIGHRNPVIPRRYGAFAQI
jgi:hypothetical protein